jgi:8-oxo-dGTP diphosphatase
MKTIKVVCGIIWKDGQVFIASRSPEKSMGAYWEFPGSKVEENEKEEIALERELKEELDIEVKVGEYIGRTVHPSENVFIELVAYSCAFIAASYQLSAHHAYKFVKHSELLNYKMAPVDLYFIKNCVTLQYRH